MVLGYGKSQYASQGRPVCASGKMPAQATANSVMASAKRLIELRQVWRSRQRIAEISVPAWPMPIHHTKVDDGESPTDRNIDAPDPRTFDEQVSQAHHQHVHHPEHDQEADDPSERYGTAQHDVADLLADGGEGVPRAITGTRLSAAVFACSLPCLKCAPLMLSTYPTLFLTPGF